MKRIGVVTTSRADFGIYLPLLSALSSSPEYELRLFVGGMHAEKRFGNSHKLIEDHGYKITELIHSLDESDDASGIAVSIGNTTTNFGKIWQKHSDLDLVFCLGDRFEMFAAISALIPFNIPIAHLYGGEITLGAIDNKFRNALTTLADFHFVSIRQNGVNAARIVGNNANVFEVGLLSIDNILNMQLMSQESFDAKFGFDISQDYALMTYHSETVNVGSNRANIDAVIQGMRTFDEVVLCTLPNADTEGSVIREALLTHESAHPEKIKCFENLGQLGYFTAMANCRFMYGNTSSGILEAASYKKPVINIGDRQKGRFCAANVIHVSNDLSDIEKGIALLKEIKGSDIRNPYGDGKSTEKIIAVLKEVL